MQENFGDKVDFVIDGGIGSMIPSTVVDCTTAEWLSILGFGVTQITND